MREPKRASSYTRRKNTQRRKRKRRGWKPNAVEKRRSSAGQKRRSERLSGVSRRSARQKSVACS